MMTIEEKAKAYDEALEKVRPLYERAKKDDSPILATYEHLFPQLAESEDERIRKSIICLLQVGGYMSPEDKKEAYAWLEKQKEPLPIPDKFSGLKSLMLQYLQSAANRKDDSEIESDTDLCGRKILDYVWKYSDEQKEQKSSIVEKLREISTPADEDWFEIEKKWETEDNEDSRSFISVKFASNAKVIDGKRFAVFTWERFKDIALELINRGKEKQKEQKDYHKLYEDIAQSKWFKKAYVGKSLGEEFEKKEKTPTECIDFDNEFEKAIKEMMRGYVKMPDEVIKETAARLLDLATKEIGHKWVIRQESYQDGYINGLHDGKAEALKDLEESGRVHCKSYDIGYDDGMKDALKDLPRWKKAERDVDAGTIDFAVFHKNDGGDHEDWFSVEATNRLYKDEYYLELSDLEKLPGFKDDKSHE